MANWNEIHTAAHVAKLGTVSAAADELGIHRATVIRHIEQLEKDYGAKLFIRAKNGYTPTDLGLELRRVSDLADARFLELKRIVKTQADHLQGELVVATLDLLVPDLLPVVRHYTHEHPDMKVHVVAGETLSRLEYGEADIAFRAGAKPDHPDQVVAPFVDKTLGLFASADYVKRNGTPEHRKDYAEHTFIGSTEARHSKSPFLLWMAKSVPADRIQLRFNDFETAEQAILGGLGIGFIPHAVAQRHKGMVEIRPSMKTWMVRSWRVTHVDMHRSAKVRAFLAAIKAVHAGQL